MPEYIHEETVNHPSHYLTAGGLETIDVMENFTEGLDPVEAINTAQVLKYICRWKKKNGLQDIEKAIWYLNRLKNYVEKKENAK